jgi:hypothetical protein
MPNRKELKIFMEELQITDDELRLADAHGHL